MINKLIEQPIFIHMYQLLRSCLHYQSHACFIDTHNISRHTNYENPYIQEIKIVNNLIHKKELTIKKMSSAPNSLFYLFITLLI